MYRYPKKTNRRSKANSKKPIYLGAALLVAVAAILLGLWLHNRQLNKPMATIPSTTSVGSSAPTNNHQAGQNTTSSNSSASSSGSNSSKGSASTSNAVLIVPWGDFVSNHRPGQNGAPTTEASTCNTTPGASCYIRFTNGSQTRTLDTKVADGNGAIIWNWDVKSAGFSAGSWKITAIATLNGQTKSASDSLSLVVQ